MPRWSEEMAMEEGLVPKIRKRGCSSSSSTSSRVHHYRFKRAILVGKARNGHGLGVGMGGSRSTTPVPTWKMSAVESPKYSQSGGGGRSRPVSARRLAATLWEMNEMPTPRVVEKLEESKKQKKMMLKAKSGSGMGSFPPHLSDPSHSPVSERIDRSGTGSHQRRASVINQRLKHTHHSFEGLDSLSSASLMETETRSRTHVPSEKDRLKDVSNALTTSKELLKIINRIWSHADQPSSTTSLVSALHTELERARLLVNQLIQERRSDQNDSWKRAIEAIEVERKLRQRSESLNKKLGKELAETKSSLLKAVQELEGETRAREITEQVCDELAKNIGEDKWKMDELKRESVKLHEEVEKEREMLHLADKLREERVHMKLSEAKHQFEEKNSAINKLRRQLEAFLGKKRVKDVVVPTQLPEEGEVDDGSGESDLHSIELTMDSGAKNYKWAHADSWRAKRESLQRSVSDVEDVVGPERLKKQSRRKSAMDRNQHQSVDSRADQVLLSNPRGGTGSGLVMDFSSPARKVDHLWSSRASVSGGYESSSVRPKSRLAEIAGEGQSMRRSKR